MYIDWCNEVSFIQSVLYQRFHCIGVKFYLYLFPQLVWILLLKHRNEFIIVYLSLGHHVTVM